MIFRFLALVPIGLFLYSLTQPGLLFSDHEPVLGYRLLLRGWWELLPFNFPWFASVFFFASLILAAGGQISWALLIAFLSLLLASLSYLAEEWYFNEGSGTPIIELGPAFDFWIGSFAAWVAALSIKRVSGKGLATNPSSTPSRNPTPSVITSEE